MNMDLPYVALILSILLTPTFAVADNPADRRDAAEKIVTDYVGLFVRDVQTPFYLYNWRKNSALATSSDVADHPAKYGQKLVYAEAPLFIPGMNKTDRAWLLYGGGLYAALDPVATDRYGGTDPGQWALLAMKMPVGARMLDMRGMQSVSSNQKLKWALAQFSCSPGYVSSPWWTFQSLLSVDWMYSDCSAMLTRVIGNLKIDAFFYNYDATSFTACDDQTEDRSLAVVFTSNAWLKLPGADAELYTSRTTGDRDGRNVVDILYNAKYPGSPKTTLKHWGDVDPILSSSDSANFVRANIFECDHKNSLAPIKPGTS